MSHRCDNTRIRQSSTPTGLHQLSGAEASSPERLHGRTQKLLVRLSLEQTLLQQSWSSMRASVSSSDFLMLAITWKRNDSPRSAVIGAVLSCKLEARVQALIALHITGACVGVQFEVVVMKACSSLAIFISTFCPAWGPRS